MRAILPAIAIALLSSTPVLAQTVTGYSVTSPAGATSTAFQIQPQANVAAADYVKLSADAANYRSEAAKLAVRKAQRADVRAYAKAQLSAAERQQGALKAALRNKDRVIAAPSTRLSSARSASLELLRKAPRDTFDNLYLTQVIDDAPAVWALQKGYADDGADPALRQVATVTVPAIEQSYGAAKGLVPAAYAK